MVNLIEKATSASRNIGLSFSRSLKAYSIDDELLTLFSKNVKAAIPAFEFLSSQATRNATKSWPRLFKSCRKIVLLLIDAIGDESLQFEDMDRFYDQFDSLRLTSETIIMHPKERNFSIPSVQVELENYRIALDHLETRVVELAVIHADQLKLRITVIVTQLKNCRKSIAYRDQLGKRVAKFEKKIRSMTDKNAMLDVQKRAELAGLEASLEITKGAYDTESANLKLVLPEFLTLVEEFLETVTQWTVSFHHLQIHEVKSALEYIKVFHGFQNTKSDGGDEYADIVDQWESDVTATRLQLESVLLIIYNKNPDRLDEEIDEKDGSLKASKLWTQMTHKMTHKLHKIKAENVQYGIFDEDMLADPLISFGRYNNHNANLLELYHPSKIINEDDIHVPVKDVPAPPALPPRDLSLKLLFSPKMEAPSPVFRSGFSPADHTLHRSQSHDSLASASSASEMLATLSDSEESTSHSDFLDRLPDANLSERSAQLLVKQYNSAKNDITECPVLPSKYDNDTFRKPYLTQFQPKDSISSDILKIYSFFNRALSLAQKSSSEDKFVIAKLAFLGQKPGDLSFSEGEKIKVIMDLQDDIMTYNPSQVNWFVGATTSASIERIGFAPSNCFEH